MSRGHPSFLTRSMWEAHPPWSPSCQRLLAEDRKQAGWSIGRAAWRLGVSVRDYREIEDGERSPAWETFDPICKMFGWQRTFIGVRGN
jgi:DNA-binding XRE family transcriptional regulator